MSMPGSSFFPRGIECLPLVLTLTESLSGSGTAIRGAGQVRGFVVGNNDGSDGCGEDGADAFHRGGIYEKCAG